MPLPAPLEIETRTRCVPRLRRETLYVARLPKLASVRRATRTQRRPFLRSTVIVSIASRVVVTVTVAERLLPRLRALADSEATWASGQPSFVAAASVGQASVLSGRASPS